MSAWPFHEPPDCPVLAHHRLFSEDDWIAYVVRAPDGGWCFHCAELEWTAQDLVRVPFGRMFEFDESLRALADLPPGWHAWRGTRIDSWKRAPIPAP